MKRPSIRRASESIALKSLSGIVVLLVIFSTTVIYFLMQWLKPLLPGLDPVFIKMGLEFIMNFFNYAVSRFFVFDDRKAEHGHEA